MPTTRGTIGSGRLNAAINESNEDDKHGDVEDGLRQPLLSRQGDGDAGDRDTSGCAETANYDDDTGAAAAETEKEAGPVTKPSSFIDLFFFADMVSCGVIYGKRMDALMWFGLGCAL